MIAADIDSVVSHEELYVAQHALRQAYPMLQRAREKFPGNSKIAAAVHALFICLRATDEALDQEWNSDRILDTITESREAMYTLRVVLNSKQVRA
jgi:hypothetical protein